LCLGEGLTLKRLMNIQDEKHRFSSRIINLTRGANKGTLSTSNFLCALALDKLAIDALRADC